MSQPQVVQTFFVTLKRSFIGRPWFHKRILESLGFKRRMQCIEKPNNARIRGELFKVAHLVRIETDQMYLSRKLAEAEAVQLQPPILVTHGRAAPAWQPPPARAAAASSAAAAAAAAPPAAAAEAPPGPGSTGSSSAAGSSPGGGGGL